MQLTDDDSTSITKLQEGKEERENGQRVALAFVCPDRETKCKRGKCDGVVDGVVDPAARNQALPTVQQADYQQKLDNRAIDRHEGLTKAESSLLTQARTGAIGLKDFLFRAKVPRISTPYCECGRGRETVEHLAV